MISKTRKNHLIPLDYEEKRFATNNELLIDKDTQDLYAIDNNGKLISFYDEYLSKLEKDEVITKHTIYGIKINMSNPDSEGSVTYTNDSKKFTPLSVDLSTGECNYGSWKDIITDFFGVRPCIFSDRVEVYLDPNDYSKTVDGNEASNYSGNVMIEFKKLYYKFSIEGDYLYFKVSDGAVDNTYIQDAFLIDSNGVDTVNEYMYISAYPASKDINGNLKSEQGTRPYIAAGTLSDLLSQVESDRYTVLGYTKYLYLLGLSWLVSRSLDTSVFGTGDNFYEAGTLSNKGLFYGTSNGPNKIFGLENLWNGIHLLCAGLTIKQDVVYLTKHGPYLNAQKDSTSIELGIAENQAVYGYPFRYESSVYTGIIFPKNISLDNASIDHFQGMCIYVNDSAEKYLAIENSGSAFQFFDSDDTLIPLLIRLTYC